MGVLKFLITSHDLIRLLDKPGRSGITSELLISSMKNADFIDFSRNMS